MYQKVQPFEKPKATDLFYGSHCFLELLAKIDSLPRPFLGPLQAKGVASGEPI